ncbi:MAG: PDZ domain-containing protein [Verrucomicrobia bacterium]|nr:PDZ domain-containing protein [bacterium]NDA09640.1 PDZ domain-containing protein [Verrucomicrobiota bacterium]NDA26093.1 PDZ domain-containing protein [Verrucomicrobiota bacterium]NDD56544.1 PDZ domain-containing protein [Verrucomicrobiota bacterium]NDD81755.1 PDZ domain-containing protein [Verrucomicrobiota bacterium]
MKCWFLAILGAVISGCAKDGQLHEAKKNTVMVEVTSQVWDYRLPWNPGTVSSGRGAGFIVAGKRIITNAHVISGARNITVQREADPRRYAAKVKYVAHDCDLAMLEVEDPAFFKGTTHLDLGGIPELESVVSVYGFPIGGDRLSVTRGVVSRIDYNAYTHSGRESHLAIQIDAAINPGNSGGPVMQSDKVVGVAFQGFRGDVAQNVGYMIPTPVIRRFLKDVEDGRYDYYVDIAVRWMPLENPAMRKYLGLANDGRGVVVTDVFSEGSSDGYLNKGDVLLSIDGHPIESDGSVRLEGKPVQLEEIVERKFSREEVRLEVWRGGQTETVNVPLKPADMFSMYEILYEPPPRYVLYGGLVFQPLTANLMAVLAGSADLRLKQKYTMFATDQMYRETPEPVILSAVLPDPSNVYLRGLAGQIVREINGRKIRTLADVEPALAANGERSVIRFEGDSRPAVLKREEVDRSTPRIMAQYGISEASRTEVGSRRLAKGSYSQEEKK